MKDSCEVCYGEKGGVPGNENLIKGFVVCDYCSCDPKLNDILDAKRALAKDRLDKQPKGRKQ